MTMRVQVALATPQRQEVLELQLPEGSTVADALAAPEVVARWPRLPEGGGSVGIWSKPCGPGTVLRDGDRVEVYRPLAANPRDARRARARLKPSTRSRNGP